MLFITKLIGLLISGLGLVFILEPSLYVKFVESALESKRVHITGIAKVVCGLIFVIAAPMTQLAGFIGFLGLLSIVSGVVIFLFGENKVYPIIKWWEERPIVIKKAFGLLVFLIGAIIVFNV